MQRIARALGYAARRARYRLAGVKIGSGTKIEPGVRILGNDIRIGQDCYINRGVYIDLSAHVTIGDRVVMGHGVTLITANHEIGPAMRRAGRVFGTPIVIEDGVWIAANATILPGVTLGAGSVVAACAVVTRSIPPNDLVAGIPAVSKRILQ